jgi:PAS domain S-box-containing protein
LASKSIRHEKSDLDPVNDISQRQKTQAKITRAASFPELNPNPVLEADFQCKVHYANPATLAIFPDIKTAGCCHPLFSDWENTVKKLLLKQTMDREVKVGEHWYLQQLYLVSGTERIRIYSLKMDEQKKAQEALVKLNRHLRAISNSNQALMRAVDETTFTKEVCDIIIHDCNYALVWVGYAENDEKKSVTAAAHAGYDSEHVAELKLSWSADNERGRGPIGIVIRTGEPYIFNLNSDPKFEPWQKELIKRGYAALAVFPLKGYGGKVFGVINICSKESDPFSEEEVKLLTELTNDFAYGISLLRLRKEKEGTDALVRKQASLIDLSPDAIIIRTPKSEITFWSEGAEKLYGWKSSEVIGKITHRLLNTQFSEPPRNIMQKLRFEGKWVGELQHQTRNGQVVIVQSFWLATKTIEGEISEIMESNVDISHQKEMQNKLEEYAAHLEELVQERTRELKDAERLTAIGETAGMVGHDLRNPLQTVTNETYLAQLELNELPESPSKKNLAENIKTISEQISYMNKIVSDLQDFVKPLTPDKKSIDVTKLVKETLKDVAVPSNIQTTVSISESLPEMMADSQLLKRVFFNLFNNAVQAMPNGGKLTISLRQKNYGKSGILIEVQDTGEGIPDAIKDKVFKPLFTTKAKGQGFGLTVCKRVVEAHGGAITFESETKKGARFLVELPTN